MANVFDDHLHQRFHKSLSNHLQFATVSVFADQKEHQDRRVPLLLVVVFEHLQLQRNLDIEQGEIRSSDRVLEKASFMDISLHVFRTFTFLQKKKTRRLRKEKR